MIHGSPVPATGQGVRVAGQVRKAPRISRRRCPEQGPSAIVNELRKLRDAIRCIPRLLASGRGRPLPRLDHPPEPRCRGPGGPRPKVGRPPGVPNNLGMVRQEKVLDVEGESPSRQNMET